MTTRKTPKKKIIHYSMFQWKTLCGLDACKGEENLTDNTNCKTCLQEAVKQHYQFALLAKRILTGEKQ